MNNQKLVLFTDRVLITVMILLLFQTFFLDSFIKVFKGVGYYSFFLFFILYHLLRKRGSISKLSIQSVLYLVWVVQYFFLNEYLIFSDDRVSFLGINLTAQTQQLINTTFVIVASSIWLKRGKKHISLVLIVLVISLVVNIILTARMLQVNPNVSKFLATGNANKYTSLDLTGVSGYEIVYSISLMFPICMLFVITTKGKLRIASFMVLILFLSFIFETGYFIAIVLMIISALLVLFLSINKWYKFFLLPILLILLVVSFSPLELSNFLWNLSLKIESVNISERIKQISSFISVGSRGSALFRLNLYENSISAFLSHPLLGSAFFTQDLRLSGHSAILDILGSGGLIHLLPFLGFFYLSFKKTIALCTTKISKNTVISMFMSFLILACINTVFSSPAVIASVWLILPLCIEFISAMTVKRMEDR